MLPSILFCWKASQTTVCCMDLLRSERHTSQNIHIKPSCFFIPSTPIPFIIGLQTARTLDFNINFRESNNTHLTVTQCNATFSLILQSHPWIAVQPLNVDPQSDKNWNPLINMQLNNTDKISDNFCFPVSSNDKHTPTWLREGWYSHINQTAVPKLHDIENTRHRLP